LRTDYRIVGGVHIFEPRGRFNGDNRHLIFREDVMSTLISLHHPRIIIDCCKVEFAISKFMGVLIEIKESVSNHAGTLIIVDKVDGKVCKIMTVMGFLQHQTFTIFNTVEEALSQL